jgi:hypothetical protein
MQGENTTFLSPTLLSNKNQRGSQTIGSRVARFFLVQHTKTGTLCQTTTAYTNWPYKKPTFTIPRPFNYTQNEIFGLKIYHLATLFGNRSDSHCFWILILSNLMYWSSPEVVVSSLDEKARFAF